MLTEKQQSGLLEIGHGCWDCDAKKPDHFDCGNCYSVLAKCDSRGMIRAMCPRWTVAGTAELARLRAEVERLAAELADETQAVERLVDWYSSPSDGDNCCPPKAWEKCQDRAKKPSACAACWAAWARSKEVK